METYLFKFSACLTVFWLIYILVLERQTMHRFKRFYLLVAIATALLIPTLTITKYVEPVVTDFEASTVYMSNRPALVMQAQEQTPFFDLETVLWMLYGLGVFIFAIRFVVNLYKMYNRISQHKQIEKRPFIYVLLEECRIPHSFFKYLFFEKTKYETDAIPDEVKLHEKTHAKQLHSLDIIIIELLQIIFWFHPLIYFLKHHIKLNHEFLADQAVLEKGIDTKAYQKVLLQFSSNTHDYKLSSAINYSSIKKRFTVMKTQTSKTRMWLSTLLLLPIIAVLFYGFAEQNTVIKKTTNLDTKQNNLYSTVINPVEIEVKKDSSLFLNNESIEFWEIPRKANYINKNLTKEEKQKFVNASILIPNASYLSISKLIIEELRKVDITSSSTGYLENNVKAGFEPTHFSPYAGKTVEEAKAFRKEIETKLANDSLSSNENSPWSVSYGVSEVSYIEDPLKRSENSHITDPLLIIKEDNSLLLNYEPTSLSTIKNDFNSITGNKKSNLILKTEATVSMVFLEELTEIIGNNLSTISYSPQDAKISPAQVVPRVKQTNQVKILKTNKNKNITLLENWFITIDNKKYYYPYKKGDLRKYYDKYGNEVDLDIVKEYLKKYKIFEALKNTGKHYIYKSKAEQKNIEALFSDLGGMYFRMTKENKVKVERPISPVKPYTKVSLNGKTYYKLFDENTFEQKEVSAERLAEYNTWAKEMKKAVAEAKNTNEYPIIKLKVLNYYKGIYSNLNSSQKAQAESFPQNIPPIPPPPPPAYKSKQTKGGPNANDTQQIYNPNFLEYIIEMEEKGATFFLDGKKISSEKAKSIAKNNKGKRTSMITQKDANGRYLVKLSSSEKEKVYARSIEVNILNDNTYLIDGIKATKSTFNQVFNQLHQDISVETRNKVMNIHVSSSKTISNKETWFIFNSLQDYGFYRIVTPNQVINRAKGNTPFAIENTVSNQQNPPTAKEVAEYNAWAKQLKKETLAAKKNEDEGKKANYPIVKQKDLVHYVDIYQRMTPKQKQNSVELPIADAELKATGLKFPPPPPPTLPPPPPPKSIKTALKNLIEAGVPLYYNEKLINSNEALQLVENGTIKHINHQNINGEERVILSETMN